MKASPPQPLPLKATPPQMADERGLCPICGRAAGVAGRSGLRLVFNCERCQVRFYRPALSVSLS